MPEPRPETPEGSDETADAETGPLVGRVTAAIEDAVRSAVQTTARRFEERPGARVRRLRRLARSPLPYLYDVHPEARQAYPRELGTMTIDVDQIAGTAVGPPNQRGMDFLPLKPFRTRNWQARWQRLRAASERLTVLPPIDVVRYDGRYWVVDGHNRVAAALYNGQLGIDANVVELVRSGTRSTDPGTSLAATVEEHGQLMSSLSRRTLRDSESSTSADAERADAERPADEPS